MRQDPETTKFFKNNVKFFHYRMKLVELPYSENKKNIVLTLPIFLLLRILFENAYESFSLCYMTTFLPNLRLMRPLSSFLVCPLPLSHVCQLRKWRTKTRIWNSYRSVSHICKMASYFHCVKMYFTNWSSFDSKNSS